MEKQLGYELDRSHQGYSAIAHRCALQRVLEESYNGRYQLKWHGPK